MRIAIVGIGAMGCLYASRLSGLADLTMYGSWAEQLTTLSKEGLTYIHRDGQRSHYRVRATGTVEEIGLVDLALIVVKSPNTERAAKVASQVLTEKGLALTLQNGLGNLEVLATAVGEERSALGVTSEGATLLGPGLVRHAGSGQTHLATSSETEGRLGDVASLLRAAGFATYLVKNVESLVWGKLAVNAGINPLTALLQVPNGFLANDEVARALMSRAAEETAVVARSQGIELPFGDPAKRALEVALATAGNWSSMAQDVARGVTTEIDAICGAVVRCGRRSNIETPVNDAFLRLIQAQTRNGDWRAEVQTLNGEISSLFAQLASMEPAR